MNKQILYQFTPQDFETYSENMINKVLDKRAGQPEKDISVDEYCQRYGKKRQTVLKYLRTKQLKGHKTGKFWFVIIGR